MDGVAPDVQTGLHSVPDAEESSVAKEPDAPAPATSDVVSEAEETVRSKSSETNVPVEALQAAAISIAKADSWSPALWATIAENWDAHFIDALNRYPNDRNLKDGIAADVRTTAKSYVEAWAEAGGSNDSATALEVLARYVGLEVSKLTPAHYALGIEKAGIDVFGLVAVWKKEGGE